MAASRTSSVQAERDIIDLPLEVKAGGMPGEFEGYGAVFGNIDRDGDVVTKGAFADSLKERLPALLWQHNPKEPIGRFDVVREDAKGLFVKGRLSQSGKGAEAYELLKMGALNGLSIGFVTKEAQRSSASGARQITRADLMEVSLVTFPANELARVQTVKQREPALNSQTDSEDPSIRDPRSFERFLRENGFSRSRAKAITAKGFKGGGDHHSGEIESLIVTLKEGQNKLDIIHSNKCAPCQKSNRDEQRCEALKNDIIDGNKSRWKAWQRVSHSAYEVQRRTKAFAKRFHDENDIEINMDLLSIAESIAAIATGGAGLKIAVAVASITKFIATLYTYNGRFAREFQREVGPSLLKLTRAKDDAKYLDRIFWEQVRAHEREGCNRLPASAFNRPTNLRF